MTTFTVYHAPKGHDFDATYQVECTGQGRAASIGYGEHDRPAEYATFELVDVTIDGGGTDAELAIVESEFETEDCQQKCLDALADSLTRNQELAA